MTHWLYLLLLLAAALFTGQSQTFAQADSGTAGEVRSILPSEWEVYYPAGVAYSPNFVQLHLIDKELTASQPADGVDIVTITPYESFVNRVHLDFALGDAINVSYVAAGERLFLIDQAGATLAQLKAGESGNLDPSTLLTFDISWLGLVDPQGLSSDAANLHLFLLDGTGSRAIRLDLLPDSGIDETHALIINLTRLGIRNARGIAFHPGNQHLYIGVPPEGESQVGAKLYEITQNGELVAIYDLDSLALVDPRAMVFAPSADLTDPVETIHLYIADSNLPDESPTPVSTSATAIPAEPTSTPISTAPPATATVVASDNAIRKTGLFLPLVANSSEPGRVIRTQTSPPAIFGRVMEVKLECSECSQD